MMLDQLERPLPMMGGAASQAVVMTQIAGRAGLKGRVHPCSSAAITRRPGRCSPMVRLSWGALRAPGAPSTRSSSGSPRPVRGTRRSPGRRRRPACPRRPRRDGPRPCPSNGRWPTSITSDVQSAILRTDGSTESFGLRPAMASGTVPGARAVASSSAVCCARSLPLWTTCATRAPAPASRRATASTSRRPAALKGRSGSSRSGTASPCWTR